MNAGIARHFATVGHRQVHYRRAGHGPPVILLHEAPRSSVTFESLMTRLAVRHTVIAPDTPGNGYSEPLGIVRPSMTDFARGLAEFLDVLGIPRCGLYGYHTGAACALEFAYRFPTRVARAVVNGYLQLDPAFCADIIENYFAPLGLDWSGSHLAWLWARMQEQWSFFPWYRKTLAFRPLLDPPGPAELHAAVLEMLDAGDAYRDSYRAAFGYDAAGTVQRLQVPTLVTTARDDVLFSSLALMPTPAPCVRVLPAEDLAHAERLLERELASIAETLPEPPAPHTAPRPDKPWSSYVMAGGMQLHLRQAAGGSDRPSVVQHSAVESAYCVERLVASLASRAPAVALDLPGRGLSAAPTADLPPDVAFDADCVAEALHALGIKEAAFVGWRAGASVGLELARRGDRSIHHLVAVQPTWRRQAPSSDELLRLVPDFIPDGAGTQFLMVWHLLRNQELYDPWYERRLVNLVRHHEPDLEPAVTQRRLEAWFRCRRHPREYWAAALRYPAFERLEACRIPIRVSDPSPEVAAALGAASPAHCSMFSLPQNDFSALAAAILDVKWSL